VVSVIVYGYVARPGWIGVSGKKFWDYLELLIVPAALAVGVAWLNWAQRKREREAEVAQQRRELEIQDQRSQDESLQAYLDQLTQLLVTQGDHELIRMRVDEGTREVIRARSEPLLRSLDPTRRWSLILFLSVMGLLAKDHPVVSLARTDLRGVDGRDAPLEGIYLEEANLSKANLSGANLSGANLERANLSGTDLRGANLSGANLNWANLKWATLIRTDLSQASLYEADLSYANLGKADLSRATLGRSNLYAASLYETHLSYTYLKEANLSNVVGVTNEELERPANLHEVNFLEGATMPDGQKYEDWLKSKDGGEGEENSGPS
jgi:uncharacterized protein YjbI with pentapeptide repeats